MPIQMEVPVLTGRSTHRRHYRTHGQQHYGYMLGASLPKAVYHDVMSNTAVKDSDIIFQDGKLRPSATFNPTSDSLKLYVEAQIELANIQLDVVKEAFPNKPEIMSAFLEWSQFRFYAKTVDANLIVPDLDDMMQVWGYSLEKLIDTSDAVRFKQIMSVTKEKIQGDMKTLAHAMGTAYNYSNVVLSNTAFKEKLVSSVQDKEKVAYALDLVLNAMNNHFKSIYVDAGKIPQVLELVPAPGENTAVVEFAGDVKTASAELIKHVDGLADAFNRDTNNNLQAPMDRAVVAMIKATDGALIDKANNIDGIAEKINNDTPALLNDTSVDKITDNWMKGLDASGNPRAGAVGTPPPKIGKGRSLLAAFAWIMVILEAGDIYLDTFWVQDTLARLRDYLKQLANEQKTGSTTTNITEEKKSNAGKILGGVAIGALLIGTGYLALKKDKK